MERGVYEIGDGSTGNYLRRQGRGEDSQSLRHLEVVETRVHLLGADTLLDLKLLSLLEVSDWATVCGSSKARQWDYPPHYSKAVRGRVPLLASLDGRPWSGTLKFKIQ